MMTIEAPVSLPLSLVQRLGGSLDVDPLSILFWLAALLTGWKAVQPRHAAAWGALRAAASDLAQVRRPGCLALLGGFGAVLPFRSLAWWMLTGLLIGAGVLCKPTNAALLPGLALFVLLGSRRHGLGLLACTAAAVGAAWPMLAWNARHDWTTLRHLAERGELDEPLRARAVELLEFVAGQTGVFSPLLYAGMLVATVAALLASRRQPALRYLLCASLPLVIGYHLLSLNEADPFFHPKHLDLASYYYDEAYHNGDLWLWLSGAYVSALNDARDGFGQTRMLMDEILDEGAVGTLQEIRDGARAESNDEFGGATSQAWSLAELLRNVSDDYLGLDADLTATPPRISIRPQLPPAWPRLLVRTRIGEHECVIRARDGEVALEATPPLPESWEVEVGD